MAVKRPSRGDSSTGGEERGDSGPFAKGLLSKSDSGLAQRKPELRDTQEEDEALWRYRPFRESVIPSCEEDSRFRSRQSRQSRSRRAETSRSRQSLKAAPWSNKPPSLQLRLQRNGSGRNSGSGTRPRRRHPPTEGRSRCRTSSGPIISWPRTRSRSVGLYVIAEEDCTGQDRVLIWDRNWTVVEQDPSAGTLVSEDTTVTLCSKKDGE